MTIRIKNLRALTLLAMAVVSAQPMLDAAIPSITVDSAPGSGKFATRYDDSWKLPMKGSGWVRFKIDASKTPNNAVIRFSEDSKDNSTQYAIVIGAAGNTVTEIHQPIGVVKNSTKVQGALIDASPSADYYWVMLNNGIFSVGRGSVPLSAAALLSWTNSTPNQKVQYVGFGGFDQGARFTDITFGLIPHVEYNPVLPVDFDEEGEDARKISVGSLRDGTMEAWMVGQDGMLYEYNMNTMDPNPWAKHDAKDVMGNSIPAFSDVAVSSDGVVLALSADGKPYNFEAATERWSAMSAGTQTQVLVLTKIALGNQSNIWAIDNAKNIYQWLASGWKMQSKGVGIDVAVGLDNTVMAINTANDVYRFENSKWIKTDSPKLTQLTVCDKNNAWGIFVDANKQEIWEFARHADSMGKMADISTWQRVKTADGKDASGFVAIAGNAAGTVFGVDPDGDIFNKGLDGVATAMTQVGVVPPPALGVPAKAPVAGSVEAVQQAAAQALANPATPGTPEAAAQTKAIAKAKKVVKRGKVTAPKTPAAVTAATAPAGTKVAAKTPRAQAKKAGKLPKVQTKAKAAKKAAGTAAKKPVATTAAKKPATAAKKAAATAQKPVMAAKKPVAQKAPTPKTP